MFWNISGQYLVLSSKLALSFKTYWIRVSMSTEGDVKSTMMWESQRCCSQSGLVRWQTAGEDQRSTQSSIWRFVSPLWLKRDSAQANTRNTTELKIPKSRKCLTLQGFMERNISDSKLHFSAQNSNPNILQIQILVTPDRKPTQGQPAGGWWRNQINIASPIDLKCLAATIP